MIKVWYSVESIGAGCVENFDTLDEVHEFIKKNPDFEITDIQLFDNDGYFVSDIEL